MPPNPFPAFKPVAHVLAYMHGSVQWTEHRHCDVSEEIGLLVPEAPHVPRLQRASGAMGLGWLRICPQGLFSTVGLLTRISEARYPRQKRALPTCDRSDAVHLDVTLGAA